MSFCHAVRSHNPLLRNFKLTFSHEDFEMKKLLLNLIVVLSSDLAAVQVRIQYYRCLKEQISLCTLTQCDLFSCLKRAM